jgi:hypothetical protein
VIHLIGYDVEVPVEEGSVASKEFAYAIAFVEVKAGIAVRKIAPLLDYVPLGHDHVIGAF